MSEVLRRRGLRLLTHFGIDLLRPFTQASFPRVKYLACRKTSARRIDGQTQIPDVSDERGP